jgi:hypothetical protein
MFPRFAYSFVFLTAPILLVLQFLLRLLAKRSEEKKSAKFHYWRCEFTPLSL